MKKQKQHECIVWDLIIEMSYWLKDSVLKSYGYIYIYIYIVVTKTKEDRSSIFGTLLICTWAKP